MTILESRALSAKARELREAFDAAFARPPSPPPPATIAVLIVRVGGELLAVKRAELTGFVRGENLAPAPGRTPAFLGLAGLRGELHPVWSLALLLDRAPPPGASVRWLLLATAPGGAPCALACEAFEQIAFVPEEAFATSGPSGAPVAIPWGAMLVPVVDLPRLLADLRARTDSSQPRRSSP